MIRKKQIFITNLLVLLASFFVFYGSVYPSDVYSKLSVGGRQTLDFAKQKNTQKRNPALQSIGGRQYIGGIIEAESLDTALLKKYECIFTPIGNFASVLIPEENFALLFQEIEFRYFQQDVRVGLALNKALINTNADKVHKGLGLEFPYDGKGVVVGIVDFGFDFKHEMFLDEQGDSRIKKVWIQSFDVVGNKPKGFGYGTELSPSDFSRYKFDFPDLSHGTHVASTMAGSDSRIESVISGIAKMADIVIVSPATYGDVSSTNLSGLLDAIKYIFDYADKQGKPAVINLSLVNHIGPHDGSALFDRACEYLVNEQNGRVLVTSAGNNGNTNSSIYSSSEAIRTNPSFPDYQGDDRQFLIDIWGQQGSVLCLRVGSYSDQEVSWKNEFCTDTTGVISKIYFESERTVNYSVSTSEEEFNGKPRIFFSYDNHAEGILIEVSSSEGEFFIWHAGVGGSDVGGFSSLGLDGFRGGKQQYQIGEIGGNSEAFITVGSFTSKNEYTNIFSRDFAMSSQIGKISSFSSKGPSADNKNKPDVLAPGQLIIAAFNSYDAGSEKNQNPLSSPLAFSEFVDSRQQYLGAMQGTSMSSPVVGGVIALMLEANPFLNYKEIKSILHNTSSSSNQWSAGGGYGKVDAYSAVEKALEYLVPFQKEEGLNIGNNVAGDVLTFWLNGEYENISYQISDLAGRVLISRNVPMQSASSFSGIRQDISGFSNGFYFISVQTNERRFSEIFFKK